MKKAAILGACLLGLAFPALGRDTLEYRNVDRAGFSVDLLQMPVATDEGVDGFGKYKMALADRSVVAEVSWDGGFQGTVSDLVTVASNLFNGTAIRTKIEGRRETATWDQVWLVGHMTNEVYLHMILRHCKQTGLLLTIGNISRDEDQAAAMHQRTADSLRCKPGSPADFVGRQPPSAALPKDFAYHQLNAFEILANRDGDVVVAEGVAAGTLRQALNNPAMFATLYGNALRESLGNASEIEIANSLGGVEQHRFSALNASRRVFRFAIMFCAKDQQQYTLIAFNTDRKRTEDELDELLGQVGCPSELPGSYRSRPSACDQGNLPFCN